MEPIANQSGYELERLGRILMPLGFSIDERQPYLSGERFLMAGGKLVLAGLRMQDGAPVIVKAGRAKAGEVEIESEKKARDLMLSLPFAERNIQLPEELYFGHTDGYTFLITRFIPQDIVYEARPVEEQFFIALNAFEAQEAFHATTFEHLRSIKDVFPILTAADYLREFDRLASSIRSHYANDTLIRLLEEVREFLRTHTETIERYSGYLTHTDFVPHNFRLHGRKVYMLDCVPNYATVHFGNKYEGWARFLNYMIIHSPRLERVLTDYLRTRRGEDEYLSLRLMRAYKIVFLLDYYARSLSKTTGDLHALTEARLAFWTCVLRAVLDDRAVADDVRDRYVTSRDRLRTEEEKTRQREFAIA